MLWDFSKWPISGVEIKESSLYIVMQLLFLNSIVMFFLSLQRSCFTVLEGSLLPPQQSRFLCHQQPLPFGKGRGLRSAPCPPAPRQGGFPNHSGASRDCAVVVSGNP